MSKLDDLKETTYTSLNDMDISNDVRSEMIPEVVSVKKKTIMQKLKLFSIPAVAIIIICVLILTNLGNLGLIASAQDLMKDITPADVESIELSDDFVKSQADFSIDLFKNAKMSIGENSLISPTSVYLALAMTANGADGNTLKEFGTVLGKYNLTIADINKYCSSYVRDLKNIQIGKLTIANSIWYNKKNNFNVSKAFLQTNADYYKGSAYMVDFSSKNTVNDMNNWVKSNTEGLINKIADATRPDDIMNLINTIYFEAKWQHPMDNQDRVFNLFDGKIIMPVFINSADENKYIKDDMAQGFIKPFLGNNFSFVAILPNEGIGVEDYINSLTGNKFLSLMKYKIEEPFKVSMPKFKSEYSKNLVTPLKVMGLNDCFGAANFNKMGSPSDGLFVSEVQHKTFIEIDELGIKAAAATKVGIDIGVIISEGKVIEIVLDRPFLYAIIDNRTNLPIFIGTMYNPQK